MVRQVFSLLRKHVLWHRARSHSTLAPRRLLESTFRLDVKAAREYCEADERWLGAVAFLDNDGGAGWDLLGAMLCPQWRQRPTAESCLNHPFLKEDTS